MKLQTLTVIFIIIMLPITMVVSQYIKTEISTINTQAYYDTILNNATYDSLKAFQLNESNSTTSNVTKEKMRDVNASINSFYNAMSASMGVAGYSEKDLNSYIPCLVYTLYDGYYIYTKNSTTGEHELKPYVYYTEKIEGHGNANATISYTLDNYIIITGYDKDGNYVTKSGYLYAGNSGSSSEILKENIEVNGEIVENAFYVYAKFQDQSIKYYNINGKWYSYGTAGMLIEETNKSYLDSLLYNNILGGASKMNIDDLNAQNYIKESYNFTGWVKTHFGNIDYLNISSENNPDDYSSAFNEHRREVIQKSIKSNLEATLSNYKGGSNGSYEFEMPELNETEWDKIINNVNLISFMQGIPLKNKLYKGYSVVTNTQSKEFVDPDEIYLLTNENGNRVYHKITWKGFETASIVEASAYRNVDFRRKTFNDEDGNPKYYYPQYGTACYESIVASTNVYETTQDAISTLANKNTSVVNIYYKALYRERYINYKSLNFGFND